MFIVPIVLLVSSVTVRCAVMGVVLKSAVLPGPLAMMPLSQLPESLQFPSASTFQLPLCAFREHGVAITVIALVVAIIFLNRFFILCCLVAFVLRISLKKKCFSLSRLPVTVLCFSWKKGSSDWL